jgi:hypothetical protein
MEFQIKQVRTYTTWLTIEATSKAEAETKYLEMVFHGTAFNEELEQMNVDGEDYSIYPNE